MNKILEWIKANAKEGADVSEATKLVEGLTDLNSISKDEAVKLFTDNAVFRSAFDSEISRKIEDHDNKKLPELKKSIREEVEKELNPDLTDDQKRIKALEQEIEANKAKDLVNESKAALRAKAEELNFDIGRAERYHVYGDKALEMLESDAKFFTESITNGVNSEIKTRFGNATPPKSPEVDPSKVMNRDVFEALAPGAQSDFIKNGGSLTED